RGDPRCTVLAQAEFTRETPVGFVDSSARENQGSCRERHPFGALNHQQLGRGTAPVADENEGRGGDRLVGQAHMPLTFCSSASFGLTVLSSADSFARFWACAFSASASFATLAASFASALRSEAGWFTSALLTWSSFPRLHAAVRRAAVPTKTKVSFFITLRSPFQAIDAGSHISSPTRNSSTYRSPWWWVEEAGFLRF